MILFGSLLISLASCESAVRFEGPEIEGLSPEETPGTGDNGSSGETDPLPGLSPGESFSIVGSGFGEKETVAPKYWEDFEDQASEFDIVSSPGLVDPVINDQEPYAGSYSLRTQLGDGTDTEYSAQRQGWALYAFPSPLEGGDRAFIRFWQRWSWGNEWCDEGLTVNYQIKNWQIGSGPAVGAAMVASTDGPGILQNNFSNCHAPGQPSGYVGALRYHPGSTPDEEIFTDWLGSFGGTPSHALIHEEWHLWEIEIVQSHDDVADGSIRVWLSRNGSSRVLADETGIVTNEAGQDGFSKIVLGFWIGNAPGVGLTTTFHWDDFYYDDTLSRVVVGNASAYDDCTIREVQIPTTWADSRITVTANTGRFASGDRVWVYVVNGEGEASSGFETFVR